MWYIVAGLLALVLSVQLAGALEIAGLMDRATLFSASVIASCISLLAWRYIRDDRSQAKPIAIRLPRLPKGLVAAVIIVAIAYAVLAVRLFTLYPDGWDALAYHFPLSVKWLQEGTLRIPVSHAWKFSLPGNANIAFLVFMAVGKQSLIPMANWPAALILALAVYVLAMNLSSSKRAAWTSALIALSIPIVHQQSFSGYVDLFATATFLASLALFSCRHGADRRSDPRVVFAAALACGLSVGTKSTFIVYGALFVAAAMFSLLQEPNGSVRSTGAWLTLLAIGVLIPSVFWFWRAAVETGNPMFPIQVAVGKTVLFRGYAPSEITPMNHDMHFVRSKWEWLIYPWTEWKATTGYLHAFYTTGSGFGAAFATFIPLGVVVSGWRSIRDMRRRISVGTIILVLWLLLLAVWCLTMPRVPRYGLPLWALACAIAAPTLSLAWRYRPQSTSVLLSVTLGLTALISCYEPIYTLAALLHAKAFSRSEIYAYPKFIDRLPVGSRVVNRAGPFNFSLYGEHLTNRVIPDFEQPAILTRGFLDQVNADFVVERKSVSQPSSPPVEGLILAAEEIRANEEPRAVWRLWSVDKQKTLQSAAWQKDIHVDR
jgi:hypothetical protein